MTPIERVADAIREMRPSELLTSKLNELLQSLYDKGVAEGRLTQSVLEGQGREGLRRAGREYIPKLAEHSIQCPDCLLVHSRTDIVTDGNVCRECGHRFTGREFGHGGALCTACYPYPHHFTGQDDGLLTCAHCPERARASELEMRPLTEPGWDVLTWTDLYESEVMRPQPER